MTIDDVVESIRRCWPLPYATAELEMLCRWVKDDLERKKAEPKGITRFCECRARGVGTGGISSTDSCVCIWCGRSVQ